MTSSTGPSADPVAELRLCLAFSLSPAEMLALRQRLIGGGWDGVLRAAADRSLLAALASDAEDKHLLAGIPALRSADGLQTITQALADRLAEHRANRASKLDRLVELAGLLNRAGIEPVLLKGARSLWTGAPDWRSMGDLDLLTPGRAGAAQEIAHKAGYAPMPGYENPAGWHHELNLYRDDLPGWLEFHDRGAMRRADLLLPTPMLWTQSVPVTGRDGSVVRILPPHLDLLYCAVHHHIAHRGDKFGLMSLKGLYEFAKGFAALTEDERDDLAALAATHPRLLAMLDLWLAAAAEELRLPVDAPFAIQADATVRARTIGGREHRRGNYDGVAGELLLGMAGARLKRAQGGGSWFGRQALRLKVVQSLLAPSTISSA